MAKKHTDTIKRMLDLIAAQPGISTVALADAVSISPNEVRTRLETVIDAGLVVVGAVKPPRGHATNEFRISASAPCAEGKAPDWSAIKAARRLARQQCDTPAGGGDISPAATDGSLPCDHLDQAVAVAAPPKPASPVEAGADVKAATVKESLTAPPRYPIGPARERNPYFAALDFDPAGDPLDTPFRSDALDDDTDESALARARRMVYQCSSDGIVQIHRRGDTGMALTAGEAAELHEFLETTRPIWGAAQ